MKFKRNIVKIGGTIYLGIEPSLAEAYEIEEGTPMILIPEERKKGKFIAVFREQDEKK